MSVELPDAVGGAVRTGITGPVGTAGRSATPGAGWRGTGHPHGTTVDPALLAITVDEVLAATSRALAGADAQAPR